MIMAGTKWGPIPIRMVDRKELAGAMRQVRDQRRDNPADEGFIADLHAAEIALKREMQRRQEHKYGVRKLSAPRSAQGFRPRRSR